MVAMIAYIVHYMYVQKKYTHKKYTYNYIIYIYIYKLYIYIYIYIDIYINENQSLGTKYLNIGYTPTWRDSCYLDPEGKAQGMLNSMNPDK